MQIKIVPTATDAFALIQSDQMLIHDAQEALQIMMDCHYQGASALILKATNFHPDFFDLKTGLAGDILQKFSNYDKRLAIVGDFFNYTSQSLRDFMYESNKAGRVLFVATIEEAKEKWGIR